MDNQQWRSTTILCVRNGEKVAMGGDGQVTFGETVMKGNATKVHRLYKGTVMAGFAGAVADAFALLEKFEVKLEEYNGDLVRACTQLAKMWRTDKILRQLEAMLIVANSKNTLILSGTGNVVEPENNIAAIGSGAAYARAAAMAFMKSSPKMKVKEMVKQSMNITSEICIYTNSNIIVEEL